jgi:hypothetical protein
VRLQGLAPNRTLENLEAERAAVARLLRNADPTTDPNAGLIDAADGSETGARPDDLVRGATTVDPIPPPSRGRDIAAYARRAQRIAAASAVRRANSAGMPAANPPRWDAGVALSWRQDGGAARYAAPEAAALNAVAGSHWRGADRADRLFRAAALVFSLFSMVLLTAIFIGTADRSASAPPPVAIGGATPDGQAGRSAEPEPGPPSGPLEPAPAAANPAAENPPAAAPPVAAAPAAAPTAAAMPGAADRAMLLSRGDALFSAGDVASARLYYERGAALGDGMAALRLGESYDPAFLERARLGRLRGDAALAAAWYRRARDLGNPEAEILLKSLEAK